MGGDEPLDPIWMAQIRSDLVKTPALLSTIGSRIYVPDLTTFFFMNYRAITTARSAIDGSGATARMVTRLLIWTAQATSDDPRSFFFPGRPEAAPPS
jgi:hypothetical protein